VLGALLLKSNNYNEIKVKIHVIFPFESGYRKAWIEPKALVINGCTV
jgi:hypothetical protein